MRKLALLFLFAIQLSPVALASSFPVTVKDDRDKSVIFDKKPDSVAAISVFGADLMSALGRQAVGVSTLNQKQSAFLGEQVKEMTNLGEVHETNMELLTEIDPDLIIGIRTYTEPFEEKFEEIGKFLAYDMVNYQDSIRAILSASSALGELEKGQALNAEFAHLLTEHNAKAPGDISAIFLWHWADVPYAFYDHHFTIEMMKQLKVSNILGASPTPQLKVPDATPISMETLLKLDPDVIISFKGDNGPIQNHPVWHRLKAVKNNRAYRVNDQYVIPHGPIARSMVLRELANLFYPDIFPQPVDIPKSARAKTTAFSED